jgi:hypothetical protein
LESENRRRSVSNFIYTASGEETSIDVSEKTVACIIGVAVDKETSLTEVPIPIYQIMKLVRITLFWLLFWAKEHESLKTVPHVL